jgi:tetratricopeptide (TPR) repeat protein
LYGVRVAANTGLPTIVSPLHEAEQRDSEAVFARDRDVQRFYRSTSQDEMLQILLQYQVGYVYVGRIERLIYGEIGSGILAAMANGRLLSIAYQHGDVTIYRVEPAAFLLAQQVQTSSTTLAPQADDIRQLEQHVIAEPANLDLAWQLALRYGEQGRYADAVRVLEPHARTRTNDPGVLQLYGDMLSRAGRIDDAEKAYRQAIAAAPLAANYVKLGSELALWGRLDPAEQALKQAITMDPQLGDPYFYLGQIAEERGQKTQALGFYQHYLDLSAPDEPQRADAEDAIQRLSK